MGSLSFRCSTFSLESGNLGEAQGVHQVSSSGLGARAAVFLAVRKWFA